MKGLRTWLPLATLLASFGAQSFGAAGAPAPVDAVTVIEHARVHTGDGRRIDDGAVILRGRVILAVGSTVELTVPEGARHIDGHGQWVTPGLIDAETTTGLADIFQERSSVDTGLDDHYDAVRAAFAVLDGLNPHAVAIPINRIEGVTGSVLVPSGGLVSGQGALIHLDGDRVTDMTVRAPIGVYASIAADARPAGYGARGGLLLRLRELFDDVRQYARRRADFERNQMRRVAASRLDLEALIPVIERRLPLVLEVQRAADIQAALRFADSEKIDLVLTGCEEGWLVADEIAAAQIPVVLAEMPDLPRSFEALGARMDNIARLAHAGVKVVISPRGRGDHVSRTLRLEAGNAVAYGLPWETALAAITRHPAEIFGAGHALGVLAPGASADVVVWSGDPFEPLTRPRHVFIAGREIPLVSRQTELRDRYLPSLRSGRMRR